MPEPIDVKLFLPFHFCERCGQERGNSRYNVEGKIICAECADGIIEEKTGCRNGINPEICGNEDCKHNGAKDDEV